MNKHKYTKNNNSLISIIVCTYNEEKFLFDCISGLINQTYKNIEILLIDDCSSDNTTEIVNKFKDNRIKYFKNNKNSGITFSRNVGLKKARGKFIFITDADCIPSKNWIETSLKKFKDKRVAVVEGTILPVGGNRIICLSDKIPTNTKGEKFSTGNIAYRKSILEKAGKVIDLKYDGFEDRELGLRVSKFGRHIFAKESIVYHQNKKHSFKSFINLAKRIPAKVHLIKDYKDTVDVRFRILSPNYFLVIFFPPLILVPIFRGRVKSFYDLCFIPLIYIRAVYMRYLIWKTAIEERVFVI